MAPEDPLPKLDGVTNFRELGGIPTRDGGRVRWRRIFRSGHWGGASEADLQVMRELGIGRVFDFRSDLDLSYDGHDQLPDGVDHTRLPTTDPAMAVDIRELIRTGGIEKLREMFGEGGAAAYMTQHAGQLVTERLDIYRGFVRGMAEPDSPAVLFHCSAGKDRAGWAGSCVLLALGVDEEEVIEHYLLSNKHFKMDQGDRDRVDSEVGELLRPLMGVRREYVLASFAAAHEAFGSIDDYLRKGLGLSDRELDQLRANWLE
jgi:protein-tyrosine phosphatase